MRIITGDECGILKECLPERTLHAKKKVPSTSTTKTTSSPNDIVHQVQRVEDNGVPCRARGVVDMVRIDLPKEQQEDDSSFSFASLRMNGSVELWDSSNSFPNDFGRYQRRVTLDQVFAKSNNTNSDSTDATKASKSPLPLGLVALPHQHRLCVCDQGANVVMLKYEPNDETSVSKKHLSIVQHWNAYDNATTGSGTTLKTGAAVGPLASTMALSPFRGSESPSYLAVGGRDHDVRLLDLETGKMAWKAKNAPPHPQTLLQQPIWPTSLLFLSSSSSSSQQSVLAVGTAYHQVRLYDVRCSPTELVTAPSLQLQQPRRRPFASTPTDGGVLNHRITAMVQTSEHHLIAGDTIGDLHSLDIRNFGSGANLTTTPATTQKRKHSNNDQSNPTGASSGRYEGPVGSIRQMEYMPDHHRLAVVGLDRMLRIYDTKSRKQLHCLYLKQRLNCLVMTAQPPAKRDDGEDAQDYDAADDDMDQEDQVHDYLNSSDEEGNDGESDQDDDDDDDDDDEVHDKIDGVSDDDDDSDGERDDDDDALEDDDSSSQEARRPVQQVTKRRKR